MVRGFTLIELLCVMGLLGIISAFSIYSSIGSYQTIRLHSDSKLIDTITRSARSASMHHLCKQALCTHPQNHGMLTNTENTVLYEGDSYTSRESVFDAIFPISTKTTTDTDILFYTNGSSTSVRTTN